MDEDSQGGAPEGQREPPTGLKPQSQPTQLRPQLSVKFSEGGIPRTTNGITSHGGSGSDDLKMSAASDAAKDAAESASSQATVSAIHSDADQKAETPRTTNANSVGENDISLLRRRTTRLHSRVYGCDNKPNPEAFNAALKSIESSALIRNPSKAAIAVSKPAAPSPVSFPFSQHALVGKG